MADIEKKTINQLVELENIEDSDYVIVEDFTGTSDIATKKAKVGNIKSDLYRKSEVDTMMSSCLYVDNERYICLKGE